MMLSSILLADADDKADVDAQGVLREFVTFRPLGTSLITG
jgi:hypothetical protein